jgi:hypothetical protein
MKMEWWISCSKALYKTALAPSFRKFFQQAMLYEYVTATCVFDNKKFDEDTNLYRIIYSPNG